MGSRLDTVCTVRQDKRVSLTQNRGTKRQRTRNTHSGFHLKASCSAVFEKASIYPREKLFLFLLVYPSRSLVHFRGWKGFLLSTNQSTIIFNPFLFRKEKGSFGQFHLIDLVHSLTHSLTRPTAYSSTTQASCIGIGRSNMASFDEDSIFQEDDHRVLVFFSPLFFNFFFLVILFS